MKNRADRKKQLIAQGAVYRAEIMVAKQATHESLRPDTLAKSVLHQAAMTAYAVFRNRNVAGLPGVNLQTVLPIVMAGVSALGKRKSLLKYGLVVAAVAGVVTYISKKKKAAPGEPVGSGANEDFAGPE